jgi:hypothetical protein
MVLSAIALGPEAMRGIGTALTPAAGASPGEGAEFSFEIVSPELGLAAPLCAGRLECSPRRMRLTRLERHLRTPEILSAVEGDSIVCVAPPQEPVSGRLEGLRAVLVRKGEAFVLATGAWHWIPFPLGDDPTRFMVIFRAGTGDDDLGFCELAEAVDIIHEGDRK